MWHFPVTGWKIDVLPHTFCAITENIHEFLIDYYDFYDRLNSNRMFILIENIWICSKMRQGCLKNLKYLYYSYAAGLISVHLTEIFTKMNIILRGMTISDGILMTNIAYIIKKMIKIIIR